LLASPGAEKASAPGFFDPAVNRRVGDRVLPGEVAGRVATATGKPAVSFGHPAVEVIGSFPALWDLELELRCCDWAPFLDLPSAHSRAPGREDHNEISIECPNVLHDGRKHGRRQRLAKFVDFLEARAFVTYTLADVGGNRGRVQLGLPLAQRQVSET
jgi:hypothetical protein